MPADLEPPTDRHTAEMQTAAWRVRGFRAQVYDTTSRTQAQAEHADCLMRETVALALVRGDK